MTTVGVVVTSMPAAEAILAVMPVIAVSCEYSGVRRVVQIRRLGRRLARTGDTKESTTLKPQALTSGMGVMILAVCISAGHWDGGWKGTPVLATGLAVGTIMGMVAAFEFS